MKKPAMNTRGELARLRLQVEDLKREQAEHRRTLTELTAAVATMAEERDRLREQLRKALGHIDDAIFVADKALARRQVQ